jgi:glutamate carboxypeptidase
MKGALVEVELAMRVLAQSGLSPRREIRLVIVNDEEVGSPDGRRVVAAHSVGAVAAIGLEPPLPGGGLKVGRRGVARVEITVDGVAAHAGLDASQGVSAIDELVDQLRRLRHLPADHDHAVNIGTISGGTMANVVADHARAEVGLRFGTPAAERVLLGACRSLTPVRDRAQVRSEVLSYRPAWAADADNPVARDLLALAELIGLDLATGTSGGAGDTNLTGAAGIPTVDGLGPEGAGAHAASEWASLNSLLHRAALLAIYFSA